MIVLPTVDRYCVHHINQYLLSVLVEVMSAEK